MSISSGHTFGVTEQVTNTKMNNMVNLASISLEHDEISSNLLTSLASDAGILPSHVFVTSLASGALLRYNGGTGWYAASS